MQVNNIAPMTHHIGKEMIMFKGKYAVCLLAAGISLGISACSGAALACTPKHTFSTLEKGVLTLAVSIYAPYALLEADGTASGVDGEIINKIAAMECLTVKASSVSGAAAIESVASGRADLTDGDWYRTAARAKVVGLSAPVYADQSAIYSRTGIATIGDLVGKQVGTVQGFLFVEDLRKLLGSNLHLYPNIVNLYQDLTTGRVDAGVDGFSPGALAQKKGLLQGVQIKVPPSDPRMPSMEPGQGCFPYTRGNDALGTALDEDIAALRADGTIAAILKTYDLDPSAANPGPPKLL
jgi:polar amino acid transport system substrate-binding protein